MRCAASRCNASARQPNVRQPRVQTKPRGIVRRQGRRARAPARARARETKSRIDAGGTPSKR
eukprot:6134022-Alexandrium_andersonii.AAC.1